jgi:hypothetical protein
MSSEKTVDTVSKVALNSPLCVAIVLYLLNMVTPWVQFERGAYFLIMLYCLMKVIVVTHKTKVYETPVDYGKISFAFVLFVESFKMWQFVGDNEVWITETGRDKPSRYENFIYFIRIIFLSQILMLQMDTNNDKYPLMAMNILLFVFWVTSYVMLVVMLDKQKIY